MFLMEPKTNLIVVSLFVALLCQSMSPVKARSLGIVPPEKLFESQEADVLQDKFHIVGQLLLNCLARFDNSNMPETPIVLSRKSPYTVPSKTSEIDNLRSMLRQIETQLIKCREILMAF